MLATIAIETANTARSRSQVAEEPIRTLELSILYRSLDGGAVTRIAYRAEEKTFRPLIRRDDPGSRPDHRRSASRRRLCSCWHRVWPRPPKRFGGQPAVLLAPAGT